MEARSAKCRRMICPEAPRVCGSELREMPKASLEGLCKQRIPAVEVSMKTSFTELSDAAEKFLNQLAPDTLEESPLVPESPIDPESPPAGSPPAQSSGQLSLDLPVKRRRQTLEGSQATAAEPVDPLMVQLQQQDSTMTNVNVQWRYFMNEVFLTSPDPVVSDAAATQVRHIGEWETVYGKAPERANLAIARDIEAAWSGSLGSSHLAYCRRNFVRLYVLLHGKRLQLIPIAKTLVESDLRIVFNGMLSSIVWLGGDVEDMDDDDDDDEGHFLFVLVG